MTTIQPPEPSALVLVADDNPVNLELLSDALLPEGLEVAVASDGQEVLDIVCHAAPDLILLDALMPGLDGFETCRRLKANPATESIPVIFMTSLNDTHYRVEGFKVGAVDYVTKPFERAELLARVRAQISLRRATLGLKEKNTELEATIRELQHRTEELREAHARLVKLEKQATEVRMAGGFAHEMRNALASAKLRLATTYDNSDVPDSSVLARNSEKLNELYLMTRKHLEGDAAQRSVQLLKSILETEHIIAAALSGISRDIERALNVTARILAYSRQGFEKAGTAPIDVQKLISNVVHSIDQNLTQNGVSVVIEVEPTCVLRGSEGHFFSILTNLVLNSLDALVAVTDKRERAIGIRVKQDLQHIVIQVTDTGVGISAADKAKIFEPFFSTKPSSGTGLGLSMVEKLVLLYDGTIDVQSEPGRGTTVDIRLPAPPSSPST